MWLFRRRGCGAERLGPRGEKLACRLLRRQGLKILARNYRCPAGELDVIALDSSTRATTNAETICFVEVKTRASDAYTDPAAAVDVQKRRRIRKAARYYLARRGATDYNTRYDIVSVVLPPEGKSRIEHIPDAFR